MAKVLGEMDVEVDGETYTLRLGFRELGKLQDEFGQDLAPFMSAHESGTLPSFTAIVRLVEVALARHHPEAGPDVADAILQQDMSVFGRLMAVAFPDPEAAAPAAKKKRAAA